MIIRAVVLQTPGLYTVQLLGALLKFGMNGFQVVQHGSPWSQEASVYNIKILEWLRNGRHLIALKEGEGSKVDWGCKQEN